MFLMGWNNIILVKMETNKPVWTLRSNVNGEGKHDWWRTGRDCSAGRDLDGHDRMDVVVGLLCGWYRSEMRRRDWKHDGSPIDLGRGMSRTMRLLQNRNWQWPIASARGWLKNKLRRGGLLSVDERWENDSWGQTIIRKTKDRKGVKYKRLLSKKVSWVWVVLVHCKNCWSGNMDGKKWKNHIPNH